MHLFSESPTQHVRLDGRELAGIHHILSTPAAKRTTLVRASALKCRQSVIANAADCLFELNGADYLRVDVRAALKRANAGGGDATTARGGGAVGVAANDGGASLSFSFRTDRPTTSLLNITIGNSQFTTPPIQKLLIIKGQISDTQMSDK